MTQNERVSMPIWKKAIILVISLIFFCIQLALVFFSLGFFFDYSYDLNGIVGIINIIIYITAICLVLHVIHRPIPPNFKLTWSILILVFPLLFIMLYTFNFLCLFFSKKKQQKAFKSLKVVNSKGDIELLENNDSKGAGISKLIQSGTIAPVYHNHTYKFFNDGAPKHEDLLKELKTANSYILLEYFIMNHGTVMDEVMDILEEKGKAGVRIYLLYDDIGSKGGFSKKMLSRLLSIPNCEVAAFEPIGLNLNLIVNYRDHRKIAVIDGRVAYCGGDNLSDEYVHRKDRFGYWRDNCGKFEGPIVDSFIDLFKENWFMSTRRTFEVKPYSHLEYETPGFVQAFGDGPINNANLAYDLFVQLINDAEKYIFISTPYFIIDDIILHSLVLKVKSGVRVVVLMPKIPDKPAAYYMGRECYRQILKAGGEIYEFSPGFNHAKNVIVDDKYAFIGTINFDYRSLFLHYECGVLIQDDPEILTMKKDYLDTIEISELVTYEEWKKRPIYQRIIAFILNIFSTMF